ncbi:VOC family protein [Undibacterium sp. CY18W]|uniref:VOC family protein n=1 Tax=Undibacterium hunanense TaxID=2762292 RepID=A0ABR6ZS24_9BURK|nr:VOC family protein [Undibacterium hunanense]MBC3918647.1 VOC family protein [Undibacterium hunanense]
MISHIFTGIRDFNVAFGFYSALMTELGLVLKFSDAKKPWAGWMSPDQPRPLFVIGQPFDGEPASAGNGQMIALLAPSREAVRRCHALALAHGAVDEGEPGLRPHYHPNYYGAYFRDPDGNKLCVCCHHAQEDDK